MKTSIIDKGAAVGKNVSIGHFSVIEGGAIVGDNVKLGHNVVIKSSARVGDDVSIHSFASIGDDPQVIDFDAQIKSYASIDCGSVIREGVTIHRGIGECSATKVGKNVYLMAYSHVGHDCDVLDNVVVANNVLLGGFVTVERNAFLGGSAVFHQFVTVGESAIVSGNATITCHVPPFIIATDRNLANGINLVGLKRRGFNSSEISDIKHCYMHIYASTALKKNAMSAISSNFYKTCKGKQFLDFFTSQKHDRQFVMP